MNVLLINPNHNNSKNNFPWGVLAVGSYLKTQNKNVKILDLSNYPDDHLGKLEEDSDWADIVGIGVFSSDVPSVKNIVDSIKIKYPSKPIICGGPHIVLEPITTCEYKNIDFVSYGEGERSFDLLIDEFNKENTDFSNVPGIMYHNGEKVVKTIPSTHVEAYDIDYELLDDNVIETFGSYMQVLTSRGCSYRCTFCYNPVINQQFRPRAAGVMVNEIDNVVKKYNPEVIYFRDENFFQDKDRIFDFIDLYKEQDYSFQWRSTCRASYIRANFVNDEILEKLEDINCQTLKFGLESGSQRVLNWMKKGYKVSWSKDAVERIFRSKVNGNFSFLIGLPTETYDEYVKTFDFVKHILDINRDCELIGPQYFRFFPGGDIYNEVVNNFDFIKRAESFEEYNTAFLNDALGIYKDIDYPWIPLKAKYTAQYADLLVYIYKIKLKELFHYKRIPLLPWFILSRIRFKFSWYSYLYDFYLLSIIHQYCLKIFGRYFFTIDKGETVRWWMLPFLTVQEQEMEE
jgi:radical SAM superfamily enzyme YgiQ (UPF0313 family)